ncbi:MAG: NUDIX hydrolase [Promethearchaeota archaeon]
MSNDFPEGRMEWGESLLGALKRELKEELDYSLKKEAKLFDIWNYISKNHKRHSVFIYYIYLLNKKLSFRSPEKNKILWLTKKDIKSMDIINNEEFLNRIFKY